MVITLDSPCCIAYREDIIIPEGSSYLQEGDQVIIIARESGILDLNAIYAAEPAASGGTGT